MEIIQWSRPKRAREAGHWLHKKPLEIRKFPRSFYRNCWNTWIRLLKLEVVQLELGFWAIITLYQVFPSLFFWMTFPQFLFNCNWACNAELEEFLSNSKILNLLTPCWFPTVYLEPSVRFQRSLNFPGMIKSLLETDRNVNNYYL